MEQTSLKKNAVYNAIKTVTSILFPLITFPYISRVLLPDNVGKINFGLSVISYYSLIATLGMSTYAIRECSRLKHDKEELSRTASQLFSINSCTTIIAYILLAITLVCFKRFESYRLLIIIQSMTILFTTIGADWLNTAMEDFRYITLRTIGFQILSIVLMLVFVRNEEDYIKYACISVVSSIGVGLSNVWYRKRFCTVRFTKEMNLKKHLRPTLAFFAMILSTTIFANADTTMLGLMSGDYQVGIYSTAHKIGHLVSQFVQSIILVLIPRLSVYFADNDFENANKLLRKLLSFNITLGLPCVIGVIMVAKDAVLIFAGPEYTASAEVLRIMILSFAFSLVGGSFLGNGVLLPMGKENYYMVVCLITAFCNIVLNYIFIPYYQATAAAATTAFNGFLIFVLLYVKKDKRIKINNKVRIFAGPVIGCIVIITACLVCKTVDNLYIRFILSVGISMICYAVVQLLAKNEIVYETVKTIKHKLHLI